MRRILAIETSCDDTGAAVVLDGREILSNVVSSQVAVHQKYGGVVPELASRSHIESIVPIVTEALEAKCVKSIDGCGDAWTGLVGSLLVGLFCKSLAFVTGLPFVELIMLRPIFRYFFEEKPPRFPFIGLLFGFPPLFFGWMDSVL
jgi:N6-L-threonylcarbamoyladenine synthase